MPHTFGDDDPDSTRSEPTIDEALRRECEQVTENLLCFIEQCSRRQLKFSAIINIKTGEQKAPADCITETLFRLCQRQQAVGVRRIEQWVESLPPSSWVAVGSVRGECKATARALEGGAE